MGNYFGKCIRCKKTVVKTMIMEDMCSLCISRLKCKKLYHPNEDECNQCRIISLFIRIKLFSID
jgi:hypothetical protein